MKKKKYFIKNKTLFIIGVIIFVVSLIFFLYFLNKQIYMDCKEDKACFYQNFEKCRRSIYLFKTNEKIFIYKILGKKEHGCLVEVDIVYNKNFPSLSGTKMNCIFPNNFFVEEPLNYLDFCSGETKEAYYEIFFKNIKKIVIK